MTDQSIPPCQHLRLKPDLSATTSVIAIETHLWGVICEGCGEKWDIGQVLQAIPDLAAAKAQVEEMQREIMFLPPPPPEAGDGPFERVQATLETLTALYGKIAGLAEFDVDTLRVCAETIYGKHQDLRLASVRQARNNFLQRLANALERLR